MDDRADGGCGGGCEGCGCGAVEGESVGVGCDSGEEGGGHEAMLVMIGSTEGVG